MRQLNRRLVELIIRFRTELISDSTVYIGRIRSFGSETSVSEDVLS